MFPHTAGRWSAAVALAAVTVLLADARLHADDAGPERRGELAIYSCDPDGSNVKLLVRHEGAAWIGSPHYAPHGFWLAYDAIEAAGEHSRIHVLALGGPFKGQTKDLGVGGTPCFSPDGKRIAFQVRGGNSEGLEEGVWAMNADGSDRRRLCEGAYPRFSPDGKKLLHVAADDDGQHAVFIYDLTSGSRERLFGKDYRGVPGADFSPDGRRIVFIGHYERREGELCVIDAKGSPQSFRVLYSGKVGWHPAFSPDGKRVIFWIADDETGATHLHTIDAAGKEQPKMLNNQPGPRHNSDPVYSPDGKRIAFGSGR